MASSRTLRAGHALAQKLGMHVEVRTYSSWSHQEGVPGKVVARLMGHTKVDTTLNVYTQVLDGAVRSAADRVGAKLITIVHSLAGGAAVTH